MFVSKRTAKDVANIFDVLVNDVESYKYKRKNFEIDYQLLGKGVLSESRYVLGKVILETLNGAIVQGDGNILDKKQDLCVGATTEENSNSPVSNLVIDQLVVRRGKKVRNQPSSSEVRWEAKKKYKLDSKDGSISDKVVENGRCVNKAEMYEMGVEASQLPHVGLNSMDESMRDTENLQENLETMGSQVKKMIPSQEARDKVTKELLHAVEVNPSKMDRVIGKKLEKKGHHMPLQGKKIIEEKHRHLTDTEQRKRPLSSLFK